MDTGRGRCDCEPDDDTCTAEDDRVRVFVCSRDVETRCGRGRRPPRPEDEASRVDGRVREPVLDDDDDDDDDDDVMIPRVDGRVRERCGC